MLQNPHEFVSFCKERAAKKDGYIMGAVGQDPKKWSLSSWYFTQYKNASEHAKALYWREHAERVWDCQGLVEGWLSGKLGTSINVRARNNYASWCSKKGTGKVPSAYRVPGCAVFIYSASAGYITHVGYMIEPVNKSDPSGDWWVCEARGVKYGVVMTKYSARGWNRWGLMTKYFDYETASIDYVLGTRTIRKGMQGTDVMTLQTYLMQLGFDLTKYGADGDYGSETIRAVKEFQKLEDLEIDGVCGDKTIARIKYRVSECAGTEDYPLLKRGSEGQYVQLLQQKLLELGYELPKYGADGDFGAETYLAVWAFQHDREIEQDGEVGPVTWRELFSNETK